MTRFLPIVATTLALACAGDGTASSPEDCVVLPLDLEEDTRITGCAVVNQTLISNDAVLTLEPGTTVFFERGGYLAVSGAFNTAGDGGRLLAVGTEEDPITLTSIEDAPEAGDWGCLFFGNSPTGSELVHVDIEYGGAVCRATGNGFTSSVVVAQPIDAIEDVTVRDSASHGVQLLLDGAVRSFERTTFGRNDAASLELHANQIVVPGTLTFEDEDDFVDVGGSNMNRDGTIARQDVPYRFAGDAVVGTAGARPEIVAEGGVRFELRGASFVVQAGNLVFDGTADDPIVITSAAETPAPGDWGCVWFRHGGASSPTTGVPTARHTVIEYAGGPDCGNNNDYRTGTATTTDAAFEDLTFRRIDGTALTVPLSECPPNACDHTFEDVAEGPLSCDGMLVSCP